MHQVAKVLELHPSRHKVREHQQTRIQEYSETTSSAFYTAHLELIHMRRLSQTWLFWRRRPLILKFEKFLFRAQVKPHSVLSSSNINKRNSHHKTCICVPFTVYMLACFSFDPQTFERSETSIEDFEEQRNLIQVLENRRSARKLWISEHDFNFQKQN